MIVVFNNHIQIKDVLTEKELEILKKINIKSNESIVETAKKINRYLCTKYDVASISYIEKIDLFDSKILQIKNKLH